MTTIPTVLAPKVWRWTKEAVKRDRRNRYDLLEPWVLPRVDPERWDIPDTRTDTICFQDNVPYVRPFANTPDVMQCDGCSLSPDQCIIPTVVGALVHDVGYNQIEYLASVWGWSEAKVRRLFDEIFGNVLMSLAYQIKGKIKRKLAILVARTYFTGVRAGGGIAHWTYGLFRCVILSLSISTISGCAVPPLWDWDEPMDNPVYTNVTKQVAYSPILPILPYREGVEHYER